MENEKNDCGRVEALLPYENSDRDSSRIQVRWITYDNDLQLVRQIQYESSCKTPVFFLDVV